MKIPCAARLFAVIDTLDPMTSDRPYRGGLTFEVAKAEIERMSGTQFDPRVVEALSREERSLGDMVEMKWQASDARDARAEGAGEM